MKKDGVGALVALLDSGPSGKTPRQPKPYADDDDAPSNEGASFDAAAESLLQQLNVPQGKRDQVKEALKEAVYACVRSCKTEE